MSAERRGWEVGLGAVFTEEYLGVTSYVQYGIPYLQGRIQMDLSQNGEVLPKFTLGIPFNASEFWIEPHLMLPFEKEIRKPQLGVRLQYLF